MSEKNKEVSEVLGVFAVLAILIVIMASSISFLAGEHRGEKYGAEQMHAAVDRWYAEHLKDCSMETRPLVLEEGSEGFDILEEHPTPGKPLDYCSGSSDGQLHINRWLNSLEEFNCLQSYYELKPKVRP